MQPLGSGMKNAAVIGLGTMGPGIAATLARAGMQVAAFDADPAKRDKAAPAFAAATTVLTALAVPDHSAAAIQVHDNLAACVAGADLVIETIPEDLDLKVQVFARSRRMLPTIAFSLPTLREFRSPASRPVREFRAGSSACIGRTRRTSFP